jgi:predicted GTPase
VRRLNPLATVVKAESVVSVESPGEIQGKRVLAIEDGPTLTHGDMSFGAGVVAARRNGASVVVDPRPWATASLREIYEKYSVGPVLPAMGYSPAQIADLESTINAAEADLVLIATPIDLRKLLRIDKPALRVAYELREIGSPNLDEVLAPVIQRANAASPRT